MVKERVSELWLGLVLIKKVLAPIQENSKIIFLMDGELSNMAMDSYIQVHLSMTSSMVMEFVFQINLKVWRWIAKWITISG